MFVTYRRLAFAGSLAIIMLLTLAPLTNSYAISPVTVPDSQGGASATQSMRISMYARALLNSTQLPPGLARNISLTLVLTGNATDLNGNLTVNSNASPPPRSAAAAELRACKASVTGQVTVIPSSITSSPIPDVAIVATGYEPPNPCFAGLQGLGVSIEWNIFTGNVTLTASPSSPTSGSSYQWNGSSGLANVQFERTYRPGRPTF